MARFIKSAGKTALCCPLQPRPLGFTLDPFGGPVLSMLANSPALESQNRGTRFTRVLDESCQVMFKEDPQIWVEQD